MQEDPKQDRQQPTEEETYRLSDGTVRKIRMEAPPPNEKQVQAEKRSNRRFVRGIVITLAAFALLVALLLLARTYLAEPIRVDGASMVPTLATTEYVLVTKFDYWNDHTPQRMDIVLCWYPGENQSFIKRVIGVPGDVVELRAGDLYINEQLVSQPFLADPPLLEDFGPITVEADHYCVMGDNRRVSMDSRNASVGNVPIENIIGHARYVVYPFDSLRSLMQVPSN